MRITISLVLFTLLGMCSPLSALPASKADSSRAIFELIGRLIPAHVSDFKVEFISKAGDKDVFELASKNGKIVLRGNNGVSVASALNYYLKYYAHCDITWNGTSLKLPKKLPVVPGIVRKVSPYKYRYYFNYCTFNYTMSWWDWKRWQWEIDWMALNGINMPLAITGQNAIWQRVYKSLNFTDTDLAQFFSGPAYYNWFWMGNLDGWGGPLPQSIINGQEQLEKQILAQERSFGMKPILPSFTGHVPAAFKTRYPQSDLKKTKWNSFEPTYVLNPDDPMFTVIGKKFVEEETKAFGTDHYYSADTFNEMVPPSSDSLYLSNVSDKVFKSMIQADPKANWVMQGWLFYNDQKFWHAPQIQALLNAVPNDRMIVLDLWSENYPVWNRTKAFYGKQWIWCMLHNFGGNISLYGRMDVVAEEPAKALANPDRGNLAGIGLTPEAIEQNPVMYELMLENAWTDKPINAAEWLKGYAWRRYGKRNIFADRAWEILHHTVYTGGILSGGPESIITGRPTMAAQTVGTRPRKNYAPKDLYPAWDNMIKASTALKESDGFQYDLVDITRQVMVNYADTIQRQFAAAYAAHDQAKFKLLTTRFIGILNDVDALLATRKDFLLGKWINDARKWGKTPAEKDLFEKNARNLITLWGDEKTTLHEYANKQWSGMISGFYKPRWVQYFEYVNTQMAQQKSIDQKQIEKDITAWEWKWVNGHEPYADKPRGNSVAMALRLYQKYHDEMEKAYR